MNHGDVRWYKFVKSDKRRPVVILTRGSALDYLSEVTVAPITSTIRDIPSEIILSQSDGMPRDCTVNLDHIQTVARGKVGSLITTLRSSKMKTVRRACLFALGFEST